MSAANAIFNVAALAFSFLAIIVSVVSARRQTTDARRAMVISFITDLGQRTRSQHFREARDYVLTQLSQHDPALGIYGLPEPARDHVVLVGGFYQDVGTLTLTGVLDKDLAAAFYYTDIKDVWRALERYIIGERNKRQLRGGGSVFTAFEDLAFHVDSVSEKKLLRKFPRHSFHRTEVGPGAPAAEVAITQDDAGQPQPSEDE